MSRITWPNARAARLMLMAIDGRRPEPVRPKATNITHSLMSDQSIHLATSNGPYQQQRASNDDFTSGGNS